MLIANVDSKSIHDRTGHRLDALLKYEKAEEKVISHVSAILGPNPYTGKVDSEQDTVVIEEKELNCNSENKSSSFLSFGDFNNCSVTFNVTKSLNSL